MAKKDTTVRYSADETKAMLERGEDRTDWARAGATTQAEVEAQIAADPDEAGLKVDWAVVSLSIR